MPKQRGVFEKEPGSGIWWICYFDADGQRHREKVGSQRAAQDAYFQRKQEVYEGRFQPRRRSEGLTFAELVDQAAADRRYRLAVSTVATDQQRGKLCCLWFGRLRADKITVDMVSRQLQELREGGLSGASANRYQAYLSAIFSWGVKHGKILTNPARQVKKFRESDPIVRFLSEEEEVAIRRVICEDYPSEEPEFDIALHCGTRRNELYRLTWDCVDLERKILTIQGKQHANTSKSSRRHIPINTEAARAFYELHERSDGSIYVCPGRQTGAETDRDWERWFERCVKKAGVVRFRYHDLRHTFASRCVMAGIPLVAVMEYLGHSSIAMVMRYAHLAPDYQRENIERLVTHYNRQAKDEGNGRVVSIAKGSSATRSATKKE
jgi:integrase